MHISVTECSPVVGMRICRDFRLWRLYVLYCVTMAIVTLLWNQNVSIYARSHFNYILLLPAGQCWVCD